jgi:hypothetical protein
MMVLHNLMHHIKLRTSGGLLDFFFMFHQMYVTNDDPSQSCASYKKNYFQNLVINTNDDPSQSYASYKKNYFQNLVTNTNDGPSQSYASHKT